MTIRKQFPRVQVIILTSFTEGDLIKNALETGATGYLLKDVSAEELVRAIRAANSGWATLYRKVMGTLVQAASPPPVAGTNLTVCEREVLLPGSKG